MISRLDLDKPTPAAEIMALVLSEPVPESQWHPDDVSEIKASLNRMGPGSNVYRRSDGTLTILGAPVMG